MRFASFWMMVTAVLILAYVWQEKKFYMPKPEPWPTQEGTILSNRVQPVESEDGKQYKIDLRYQYKDGDKVLEGSRITPAGLTFPSKELAERAAKAFPVGKVVQVYVNPIVKSEPPAVLIWEFPNILSPVVFIVIILIGTSVVLYLISEYKRFNK